MAAFSARADVNDALTLFVGDPQEGYHQAAIVLANYIQTLEQQARNVIQDADDAAYMHAAQSSSGRVTWNSLNALRATINFPRG